MKPIILLALGTAASLLPAIAIATAQDAKTAQSQSSSKAVVANPSPQPNRKQLEDKFIKTLTKATFHGRWCLVENGKPGPAKQEKYTINGVSKLGPDLWLIHARIQYGKKDVNVPVPVYLKWAGDTPVISITNLPIPGIGTYSARVLIYNNTYAGTWSGSDHVGLLNGTISH